MKVSLVTPLGSLGEESGLIYLLGSYLRTAGVTPTQVRCNGAFTLCDRDVEVNWRRSLDTCARCVSDQRQLAEWSGADFVELGACVTPRDIEGTTRWMATLNDRDILDAEYSGERPWSWAAPSFHLRFGPDAPDLGNARHLHFLRRLLVSAVRARRAARRLLTVVEPDLLFLTGGEDYISQSIALASEESGVERVVCKWRLDERCIRISSSRRPETLSCDLLIHRVSSMRSDSRTWPLELVGALDGILEFLGISRGELLIPAAR